MSLKPDNGKHVPMDSPIAVLTGALRYVQLYWSVSALARLCLIFLMTGTFIMGSWLGLDMSPAYAASLLQAHQAAPVVQRMPQQPSTASAYHLPYAPGRAGATLYHARSNSIQTANISSLNDHDKSVGEQAYFTYMKWQVNDHLVVEINIASGNLVLHASDLHIQGTGVDLTVDRFYNSLATSAQVSSLSPQWNLSLGSDVYLQSNSDGSKTYYSPSGTPFVFTSNGSGGYNSPSGINATLTPPSANDDNHYHLDFHKNHETYEFTSVGHMTADEDKNGNQVDYNISNGKVTSATDSQGRITTFTYDGSGRLITITDPSGRKVQYAYDVNGNLASSTDALGQATTYTYQSGSINITQINDPAGHVIKFTYATVGGRQEVASVTDATGATTNFSYQINDNGNSTVVTDARGNQTTYQSDNSLRMTKVTDALGHTQADSYTPNNDVATATDSLSDTSTFTFDGNNNILSSTDASGAKLAFSYQDSNHPFYPSGSKDAQGNSLTYTYDSPGNLTQVKNVTSGGAAETVHYSYNANGTLASMKDADSNTTTYSYDSQGNLVKITPPSPLGATTTRRDSLSRATSVTDGKGQTTSFTYDLLDRITSVTYAGGSVVSYIRDAAGNLTSQTDNTGSTTFTYDAANRLLTKKLPGSVTLTMTYDAVGNMTSYNDQGGTTSYTYNAVNLVTALTDPNGAVTSFSYDKNDRRTGVNYPNGVIMSLTHDKAGHTTGITATHAGTTLSSYSYDYEGTSLRQSMKDNVLGQETDYTYDTMNRLTDAEIFNSSSTRINDFDYTYDKEGNRISQTIGLNGTQVTFTYNTANELTSTSQGVTYSYDANGNETSVSTGGTTLTYNAKDQTTSIKGVSMNYTGTTQNQRVQAGGTGYVNSPLGISSQNDSNGQVFYTRDNRGNLVSERTPGGTFYYLFDGLGSIVGLTDSGGNLVNNERYQYDAFGNLLNAPVASLLQTNPWRYAGGYFDSATGLTKFGVRYYDATVGRWTQQDPKAGNLFDMQSSNRYVYASCDPVNVVDPGGKDAISCFFTIVVGILGIVSAIGTLYWIDPIAAAATLSLLAIPVVGEALALIAAVALIAFNVWALEGTIFLGWQLAKSTCGWG